MAKFVAGVALGLAVGLYGPIRAEDGPSPDTVALAASAGVDAVDLLGASNSTGLEPTVYLCRVGEGPCPGPPLMGAVSRADCVISKESGGRDVPNRQGSGATGPGQYMPSTWLRHSALYRNATGYVGTLSLHSLEDVRAVMSWMLSVFPGSRAEWAVSGCT